MSILHKCNYRTRYEVAIHDGLILIVYICRICSVKIVFCVSKGYRDRYAYLREVCHTIALFWTDGREDAESFRECVEETPEEGRTDYFKVFPKILFTFSVVSRYPLQLHNDTPIEEIGTIGYDVDTVEAYSAFVMIHNIAIVRIESSFDVAFARHCPTECIRAIIRDLGDIIEYLIPRLIEYADEIVFRVGEGDGIGYGWIDEFLDDLAERTLRRSP